MRCQVIFKQETFWNNVFLWTPTVWFFLLGCMKVCVFNTPVRDNYELEQKITDVVSTVNLNILANTWQELRSWLEFLQDNDGGHIEVNKCTTSWLNLISYLMEILFYCKINMLAWLETKNDKSVLCLKQGCIFFRDFNFFPPLNFLHQILLS